MDEQLICQYLQDARISKDFAIYYDLFNKYRSDYQVEKILDGTVSESIVLRAERASMDERLSLLGLIFDSVTAQLRTVCERENILDLVTGQLKTLKEKLKDVSGAAALLSEMIEAEREKLERKAVVLNIAAGAARNAVYARIS